MELKRGIVKSFDAGTYRAAVQVAGSLAVWLEGVAVARNISQTEMVAGRNCAIIFFDGSNPADAVIAAVWS